MTDDDKKLLTEFLGECWHEKITLGIDNARHCTVCRRTFSEEENMRLDFTDWRVVGRLIEKMGGVFVEKIGCRYWASYPAWVFRSDTKPTKHDTQQEAICAAVLAWLEEGTP